MFLPSGHDRKVIRLIEQHGISNAETAVEVEHQHYRPTLARCLALLENESSGRNIFGADPGGTALPRAWYDTEVTEQKYKVYLQRRHEGLTPNGVGPCQLTDPFEQDAADRRGGCWKVKPNMEVGFAFVHGLILRYGPFEGFRHYNGSGPAAFAYAERAMARAKAWEARLGAIR